MTHRIAGVVQIVWGVCLFHMVWAAIMGERVVLWPTTSVISGIHCLETAIECVWVMETGMERSQSAVSERIYFILDNIMILTTVGVNSRNIALLVLSILTWVLSIILTVIAAIALRKEIVCKQWLKITCRSCTIIVLLAGEGAFLLLVLLLWIVFSRINSWVLVIILWESRFNNCVIVIIGEAQQTSLLIAAFVLALPWTVVALIVLHIASRCKYNIIMQV